MLLTAVTDAILPAFSAMHKIFGPTGNNASIDKIRKRRVPVVRDLGAKVARLWDEVMRICRYSVDCLLRPTTIATRGH